MQCLWNIKAKPLFGALPISPNSYHHIETTSKQYPSKLKGASLRSDKNDARSNVACNDNGGRINYTFYFYKKITTQKTKHVYNLTYTC